MSDEEAKEKTDVISQLIEQAPSLKFVDSFSSLYRRAKETYKEDSNGRIAQLAVEGTLLKGFGPMSFDALSRDDATVLRASKDTRIKATDVRRLMFNVRPGTAGMTVLSPAGVSFKVYVDSTGESENALRRSVIMCERLHGSPVQICPVPNPVITTPNFWSGTGRDFLVMEIKLPFLRFHELACLVYSQICGNSDVLMNCLSLLSWRADAARKLSGVTGEELEKMTASMSFGMLGYDMGLLHVIGLAQKRLSKAFTPSTPFTIAESRAQAIVCVWKLVEEFVPDLELEFESLEAEIIGDGEMKSIATGRSIKSSAMKTTRFKDALAQFNQTSVLQTTVTSKSVRSGLNVIAGIMTPFVHSDATGLRGHFKGCVDQWSVVYGPRLRHNVKAQCQGGEAMAQILSEDLSLKEALIRSISVFDLRQCATLRGASLRVENEPDECPSPIRRSKAHPLAYNEKRINAETVDLIYSINLDNPSKDVFTAKGLNSRRGTEHICYMCCAELAPLVSNFDINNTKMVAALLGPTKMVMKSSRFLRVQMLQIMVANNPDGWLKSEGKQTPSRVIPILAAFIATMESDDDRRMLMIDFLVIYVRMHAYDDPSTLTSTFGKPSEVGVLAHQILNTYTELISLSNEGTLLRSVAITNATWEPDVDACRHLQSWTTPDGVMKPSEMNMEIGKLMTSNGTLLYSTHLITYLYIDPLITNCLLESSACDPKYANLVDQLVSRCAIGDDYPDPETIDADYGCEWRPTVPPRLTLGAIIMMLRAKMARLNKEGKATTSAATFVSLDAMNAVLQIMMYGTIEGHELLTRLSRVVSSSNRFPNICLFSKMPEMVRYAVVLHPESDVEELMCQNTLRSTRSNQPNATLGGDMLCEALTMFNDSMMAYWLLREMGGITDTIESLDKVVKKDDQNTYARQMMLELRLMKTRMHNKAALAHSIVTRTTFSSSNHITHVQAYK
jgi:hypothetical protein